jgi:hypothetical protein
VRCERASVDVDPLKTDVCWQRIPRDRGHAPQPEKNRASRNALRHGLTRRLSGAEVARDVEVLAQEIAGGKTSAMPSAREAAEATLELDRVRRIKIAVIEHVAALGRLEPAPIFRAPLDEAAWIMLHYWGVRLWPSRPKLAVDHLPAILTEEPARTTEAVRRALPELVRLNRYDRRAAARRDRAIRALTQSED